MTQQRLTLDGRIQLSDIPATADPQVGRRRYLATLITAGETLTGYTMPPEVLRTGAHLFNGAPCQIDHHFDMPSLQRTAGSFADATYDDGAVRATLSLWDTPSGDLLERVFNARLQDRAAGAQVPDVGLSAVLWCDFDVRADRDPPLRVATAIRLVESVDAVFFPAAGGRVERVLNSLSHISRTDT